MVNKKLTTLQCKSFRAEVQKMLRCEIVQKMWDVRKEVNNFFLLKSYFCVRNLLFKGVEYYSFHQLGLEVWIYTISK